MTAYTASSADNALVVTVGAPGELLRVSLSPAAVAAGDEELASRITRLSVLAYLRHRCGLPVGANNGAGFRPSHAQVAAYAATLDF